MSNGQIKLYFFCGAVAALVPSSISAQSREDPPSLLRGGLIQQLRSLSEEALESLKGTDNDDPRLRAEAREVTPANAGLRDPVSLQGAPQSPRDHLPSPPTGRAALRRTQQSTWLERLTQQSKEEDREPQQAPPVRPVAQPSPSASETLRLPEVLTSRQDSEGYSSAPKSRQRPEMPKASMSSDTLEQAPRVSRIPLPTSLTTPRATPRAPSIPQATSRTRATSTTRATLDTLAPPAREPALPRSIESRGESAGVPHSINAITTSATPPPRGPHAMNAAKSVSEEQGPEPAEARQQRLKMEAPRLDVLLNGPADLAIGVPAQYVVVVRNDDAVDLQGMLLRLDIPSGVLVQPLSPSHGKFEVESSPDGSTFLSWGFDRLPAGKAATAPIQLVASSVKNFAVALEWTLVPLAASTAVKVRAPRLELGLEGPAEVKLGQPNVYRLHVRNPGDAKASQIAVKLSADPYGSSSTEIGEIIPGEEEIIDVELIFNQRGPIHIAAQAREQSGQSSEAIITVIVRQVELDLQLVAPQVAYHGATNEYRVRLSNSGDADASDLRAVVDLPEGASFVSGPPGARLQGRELVWPIAKMAAESAEEFLVHIKLTGDGGNRIQWNCMQGNEVAASAETETQVESIADLTLLVRDPVAPAPVGSEVLYELALTNRGSKAATNVNVTAQFSEGIEPTRCAGQPAQIVPGQAFFEAIPTIGAGETVSLQVFAKTGAPGTHRFRVEVRWGESEARLVQEESTPFLEAASRMASPKGAPVNR